MSALIFLVISAWGGGNLFSFLSQLAYNSGILSKFALNILEKHADILEESSSH